MNRRNVFSFLIAAPIAAVAAKDAVAIEAAVASPDPVFGELTHMFRPMHTGYATGSVTAEAYVAIWNGHDWVPFDSADGIAVRNKLLKMKA